MYSTYVLTAKHLSSTMRSGVDLMILTRRDTERPEKGLSSAYNMVIRIRPRHVQDFTLVKLKKHA